MYTNAQAYCEFHPTSKIDSARRIHQFLPDKPDKYRGYHDDM